VTEPRQSQGRFGRAPGRILAGALVVASLADMSVCMLGTILPRISQHHADWNEAKACEIEANSILGSLCKPQQGRGYLGWVYTRIYSHDVAPISGLLDLGIELPCALRQ